MSTIDERARHELYRGAEELFGTERADTLMSLLPPVGWADVATKDDLRQLEDRIDARMDARFARVDARFANVDVQFANLELRMDTRFAQVDAKFFELEGRLDRSLREQTRTLMLGLVGAMFTMTSLCLGTITLTT